MKEKRKLIKNIKARYLYECKTEYQIVKAPSYFGDPANDKIVFKDYGYGKRKYKLHLIEHNYTSEIPLLMGATEVISALDKTLLKPYCQCIFHKAIDVECKVEVIQWMYDNEFIEDCVHINLPNQRAIKLARSRMAKEREKKK